MSTSTSASNKHTGDRLLRRDQVLEIVGFSKSYLYALIADKRFPEPILIDQKCSRWFASEVEGWVSAMQAQCQRGTGKPRGAAIGGAK